MRFWPMPEEEGLGKRHPLECDLLCIRVQLGNAKSGANVSYYHGSNQEIRRPREGMELTRLIAGPLPIARRTHMTTHGPGTSESQHSWGELFLDIHH